MNTNITFRLSEKNIKALEAIQEQEQLRSKNETVNYVIEKYEQMSADYDFMKANYTKMKSELKTEKETAKRVRSKYLDLVGRTQQVKEIFQL